MEDIIDIFEIYSKSPEQADLKSREYEALIIQKARDYHLYCASTLSYLLLQCSLPSPNQPIFIKRLFNIRHGLLFIDFENPQSAQIITVLISTVTIPSFYDNTFGYRFIIYCFSIFSKTLTHSIHYHLVYQMIIAEEHVLIRGLSQIYKRVWKPIDKSLISDLEWAETVQVEILLDLLTKFILVKNPDKWNHLFQLALRIFSSLSDSLFSQILPLLLDMLYSLPDKLRLRLSFFISVLLSMSQLEESTLWQIFDTLSTDPIPMIRMFAVQLVPITPGFNRFIFRLLFLLRDTSPIVFQASHQVLSMFCNKNDFLPQWIQGYFQPTKIIGQTLHPGKVWKDSKHAITILEPDLGSPFSAQNTIILKKILQPAEFLEEISDEFAEYQNILPPKIAFLLSWVLKTKSLWPVLYSNPRYKSPSKSKWFAQLKRDGLEDLPWKDPVWENLEIHLKSCANDMQTC